VGRPHNGEPRDHEVDEVRPAWKPQEVQKLGEDQDPLVGHDRPDLRVECLVELRLAVRQRSRAVPPELQSVAARGHDVLHRGCHAEADGQREWVGQRQVLEGVAALSGCNHELLGAEVHPHRYGARRRPGGERMAEGARDRVRVARRPLPTVAKEPLPG
jgi:hypothetical protein